METKQFKAGEIIFNKGDFELVMYQIVNGSVGIYLDYGQENEKKLVELKSGQYFGEMGLIQNMKRSADAVVLSDAEIEVIDKDSFADYVSAHPQMTVQLLGQLSDRLRDLTADYYEACGTVVKLSEMETVSKAVAENAGTPSGSWLSRQIKRFADAYNAGGVDYVHFNI